MISIIDNQLTFVHLLSNNSSPLISLFSSVFSISMSFKTNSILTLLCLQLLICLYNTYKINNILIRNNHNRFSLFAETNKKHEKWPGNRPPIVNMEILEQRMDASWGRAKYRSEVWEDDVNPLNDWWLAYAPSEEEIEAAKQGYNFKEAAAWFEVSKHALILILFILR